MSQATRPNDRHIIWSNQNLDVDDWREDYKEFLEANELDDDPMMSRHSMSGWKKPITTTSPMSEST